VIDPERLLAGDTTGYLEWTMDLEDQGTKELMDSLLAWVEETQRKGTPDSGPGRIIGQLQQWGNKNNEKELRKLFPLVVAGTMRPVGAGQDGFILAGSVRGMDHQLLFLDWIGTPILRRMLNSGAFDEENVTFTIERHAGEKIFVIPLEDQDLEMGMFLRGGDFFLASSLDEAKYAVDLLTGRAPQSEGTAAVERWYRDAPDTSLRGALSNGGGELRRLWDGILDTDAELPDEMWREVEGLVFSGGFDGTGIFTINMDFDVTSATVAEQIEETLATAMDRATSDTIFRLGDVSRAGDRVRISVLTEPLVEKLNEIPVEVR
jgi:hypothetical protein